MTREFQDGDMKDSGRQDGQWNIGDKEGIVGQEQSAEASDAELSSAQESPPAESSASAEEGAADGQTVFSQDHSQDNPEGGDSPRNENMAGEGDAAAENPLTAGENPDPSAVADGMTDGPAEGAPPLRDQDGETLRRQMHLPQMPTWDGCAQDSLSDSHSSGSYDENALQEFLRRDVAEILDDEAKGGESKAVTPAPQPGPAPGEKGAESGPPASGGPREKHSAAAGAAHSTESPKEEKGREERRRSKETAAAKREKKVRLELRLIMGLLVAGIILCLVLTVILMVRPDFIFSRTKQTTQESTAEAVTQQESESEESVSDTSVLTQIEDDALTYVGLFELPLEGATGYAPSALSVTDENGSKVAALEAGEAFVILGSEGDELLIETGDGITGRVSKSCAWINLPDVIPSIIYYDSNSVSSLFSSSGYSLPGITGEALYNSIYMNERFGEEQFCMPVLYEMAVKIMKIQQACLANGESLKIYQTFRPYETQMAVAEALQELEDNNSEVYAGLNQGAWSDTWFIATKLSNHQRGCAIDVSLVQVDATEVRSCGEYQYLAITEYTEYGMPSDMHELSYRAAVFDPPVSSSNDTAWRSATYADTMTLYAYRLLDYCTEYGLSPLSSEWWHFNDLEAKSDAGSSIGTGRFYLEECLSRVPSGT